MARHVGGLEISRYADGELAPQAAERLEQHIALCAECRARLHGELALGEELRAHFAESVPAIALERARRPRFVVRYAAAAAVAAAAVLMGAVASPQLTGDITPPHKAATGVTAFALYMPAGAAHEVFTTVQGYVVANGQSRFSVRVGLHTMQVVLPAGTSTANYPVGSAVLVHGVVLENGSIQAASIQRIDP